MKGTRNIGKNKRIQHNPAGCAICGVLHSNRWHTVHNVRIGGAVLSVQVEQCAECYEQNVELGQVAANQAA